MWKVLSPRICRESAATLEHTLNILHPINEDIKINWGNSSFSINDPREVFGNKTEAVFRSARKDVFFKLCKEMGTVPVITEFDGPCFQHYDSAGHNGSGIKYVTDSSEFVPGLLTTKQIKGKEYRVYFCYDMAPMIFLKTKLEDTVQNSAIQNSHNGYGYLYNPSTLRSISNLKKILLLSTEEVKNKLELSYGAVDFIVSEDYTVYVLESNSAPTLFTEALVDEFASQFSRRFA